MRWLVILILGAALVGCAKREAPTPAAATKPDGSWCGEVTILGIFPQEKGDPDNLLEFADKDDGKKHRINRTGNVGAIGDTFVWCESLGK